MSIISVICIGSTSRYNYSIYKRHLQDRVHACLRAFGLPPIQTLETMKRVRAVISGSSILALIEPGLFTPKDIDIYVPQGLVDMFIQFLEGIGSFEEQEDTSTTSYAYTGGRFTGE
jgi:hypothetical protein